MESQTLSACKSYIWRRAIAQEPIAAIAFGRRGLDEIDAVLCSLSPSRSYKWTPNCKRQLLSVVALLWLWNCKQQQQWQQQQQQIDNEK